LDPQTTFYAVFVGLAMSAFCGSRPRWSRSRIDLQAMRERGDRRTP
jgi:hypothetical protein